MKNNYYFLYYFFDNPFIRWVRVLVFFGIGFFVYLNIDNGEKIISLLPLYFILVLQEFFIHFKLENSSPGKKLSEAISHPIETVDYKTRAYLERHPSTAKVVKQITKDHEIRYFNSLTNLNLSTSIVDIPEEDLLRKAMELSNSVKGSYIHSVDIYASYLLLSESQTKILFNKSLDEKDILVILSWVRKIFNIDLKRHSGIRFTGSGVFDFFVFGWSAELRKYASNFTQEILRSNNTKPIGRNSEYDLLITALSKSSASNALLVGEAGVGKSTLVSQFVLDSDQSMLPSNLSGKIVFKLFADRLIAGVQNVGDLEARFELLFSELAHAGNIIVFIPNIENVFGGGGLNFDISGTIAEYLRSSRIKIIGTTTPEAFQSFIYSKQEIKELFDVIDIKEPEIQSATFMVLQKAYDFEIVHNIKISYDAVKKVCELSDSYANDGSAMPGRAIRLLDDTVSFARTHGIKNITEKEVKEFMQEKTNIVLSEPNKEESDKLLNLENDIHKKIISQNEAVKAISDAMRRVRSGMKDGDKPIASFLFLGPTGVGKTETAKALAFSYFGDENAMIRIDMSEYQNPDTVDRLLGSQSHVENSFAEKVLKKPFSLILLDEFEKAYPRILDLFLQILDEGRLTDRLGRTISFKNTIIIATSNAGSEFIREVYNDGADPENVKKALIEKVQQSNIFKPELLNRFDDVIVFKPLSENDVVEVAKLFMNEIVDRIAEKHIVLAYEQEVLQFIAQNSYSVEFGARNIRRFIEQSVENQLSKLLLSGELNKGGQARIVVSDNKIVISV